MIQSEYEASENFRKICICYNKRARCTRECRKEKRNSVEIPFDSQSGKFAGYFCSRGRESTSDIVGGIISSRATDFTTVNADLIDTLAASVDERFMANHSFDYSYSAEHDFACDRSASGPRSFAKPSSSSSMASGGCHRPPEFLWGIKRTIVPNVQFRATDRS